MNENNSKKNRPKSQIMMPKSTSPLPSHSRKNGSSDSLPNHRYENEWEVRSKELAEAKTRVAQMEKTMRWWSDCTDNWRKKWSEVKTERNELRKELRLTKNQMEKLMKQLTPRQHQESLIATESVRESPKNNGFAIYSNTPTAIAIMSSVPCSSKNPYHQKSISQYENNKSTGQYVNFPVSRKNSQTQTTPLNKSQLSLIDKEIVSLLEEKVVNLKSKLDEVNRRLSIERDEKAHLHLTIDRLRRDFSDLHELYESLKKELCELNGKEFTESEVDSYAEEETDEVRLIEQLTRDDGGGDDEGELEEDDFDPENETDIDKHTPTAEISKSEVNIDEIAQKNYCTSQEGRRLPSKVENRRPEAQETNPSDDPIQMDSSCKDLTSSIQVEILEVHKKLDLKTFISDVTGVGVMGNTSDEEAESQNEESAVEPSTTAPTSNASILPLVNAVREYKVNGTTAGQRR